MYCAVLLLLCLPYGHAQTTLDFSFQDATGTPLVPDRVLLVAPVGPDDHYEAFPLPVTGAHTAVTAEGTRLPEGRVPGEGELYLSIEKDGYVLTVSPAFYLRRFGAEPCDAPADCPAALMPEVGDTVFVPKGSTVRHALTLQKAAPRELVFRDARGTPLAGVQVQAYPALPDPFQHPDARLAFEGLSDARGRVHVPHYAMPTTLWITLAGHCLAGQAYDPAEGMAVTQSLGPRTDFTLLPAPDRSLSMVVTQAGQPVEGLALVAICTDCSGLGITELAVTDASGRLHLPFRDTHVDRLYLRNRSGDLVWAGSVAQVPGGGRLDVALDGTILPQP